eukprot:10764036-Karenia_brevis.AAC.1
MVPNQLRWDINTGGVAMAPAEPLIAGQVAGQESKAPNQLRGDINTGKKDATAPSQLRGDINTGQASGLRGSNFGGSQAKAGPPASPELQ